ncbi:MAG: hypothetical protein ACXW1F_08080, partial [Halobacteriota archaeon]
MRSFVLNEVENQLLENYDIDVQEGSFVKAVYNKLIKRFDNGIYAPIKTTDPQIYQQKLFNILEDAMREKDKHLKECISHIALGRKLQVIIIIDNADQRDFNTQQDAFIIAQNFAKDWHAAVFIAVRPQTFYHSKQSGALTAYPHRVFAISPPRVDVVIERRLKFALDMAEGKYPVERIKDVGVRLPTIALFLKALIYSLRHNQELIEFLSNITGGNIRKLVELVTKFIGSPNVDAEKNINIMEKENKYIVPVHEFWKAAMPGDSAYYHSLS